MFLVGVFCVWWVRPADDPTASSQTIPDILATRMPGEVAHPRGSNVFTLRDGTATEESGYFERLKTDIEADGHRSASVTENELYPPPTKDELQNLRKVG